MRSRPPRAYKTGAVTKWVRFATFAAFIVMTIILLVAYPTLPDQIPNHIGRGGETTAWGSRATVFGQIAIAGVIIAGLGVLSHYPRVLNYATEVTEANAQSLYRVGEQLIVSVNACCALAFISIAGTTVFALSLTPLIVVSLAGMLVSVLVSLARILQFTFAT